MVELGLEGRFTKFVEEYGVALENGTLDKAGYLMHHQLLSDAGYSFDSDDATLAIPYTGASIYSRLTRNRLEVVVDHYLKTLKPGFSYCEFDNVTQYTTFKELYTAAAAAQKLPQIQDRLGFSIFNGGSLGILIGTGFISLVDITTTGGVLTALGIGFGAGSFGFGIYHGTEKLEKKHIAKKQKKTKEAFAPYRDIALASGMAGLRRALQSTGDNTGDNNLTND